MPKIYCKQGGLMEDPDFHWEFIGEAPGETIKECCDNYAATHPEFAESYRGECHPMYGKGLTYWGWKLGLAEDVVNDVLGKAVRTPRLGM